MLESTRRIAWRNWSAMLFYRLKSNGLGSTRLKYVTKPWCPGTNGSKLPSNRVLPTIQQTNCTKGGVGWPILICRTIRHFSHYWTFYPYYCYYIAIKLRFLAIITTQYAGFAFRFSEGLIAEKKKERKRICRNRILYYIINISGFNCA